MAKKKKNKGGNRDLEAILERLSAKQPKKNRMDRLEGEIEKRRLEIISLAVALDESKTLHEKVMELAEAVRKHLEIFSAGAEQLSNRLDKLEPQMDRIEAYILSLETLAGADPWGITKTESAEVIESLKSKETEKTEEVEEVAEKVLDLDVWKDRIDKIDAALTEKTGENDLDDQLAKETGQK